MSKLLVNDMAGEFGISVDEVISLLRQMDVPVRSHLTPLSDDQVARCHQRFVGRDGHGGERVDPVPFLHVP